MPSAWIISRTSRKGKIYAVRWETVSSGRRVTGSKTCGYSREHARAFLDKKLGELYAGSLGVKHRRDGAAFAEFAEDYLAHCRKHKAPRTVRNFDSRAMALARDFFSGRSPSSINNSDVAAWETDLLKQFKPTTARMWLRCLRTALRWGEEHGYVQHVPKFYLPRVDPTGRALSDQEVQALVGAVSDRARPAVVFALHTGLRRGELLSLAWDRVRNTKEGWEAEIGGIGGPLTKTRRSRVIPLHPVAVDAMGQPGQGRVFKAINEDISHRVEEGAKKAGLGRVRFHDLRHTWATRFMQATGDLSGLMLLGGWSSLGAVQVYQHMTKTRVSSMNLVNFPLDSHTKKQAS